jgi:hypothetical protein
MAKKKVKKPFVVHPKVWERMRLQAAVLKAKKESRQAYRKARAERKHRLAQLDLPVTYVSDEEVARMNAERTEEKRARKCAKVEARQSRINAKKQRAADKEQVRLYDKWTRKLLLHEWKLTQKGWRKGREASVTIEEAIVTLNKELRQAKKDESDKIPDFLKERGWSVTGPNQDVWVRQNWDTDGLCYRTLRQAYKLQLGLDAKAAA